MKTFSHSKNQTDHQSDPLGSNQQEISSQLQALQVQNSELLSDLQRTRADFENYRKQVELQRERQA